MPPMARSCRTASDGGARHPAVRDLAFLLTAPAPWQCAAMLPAGLLTGPDACERLAALDRTPAPLDAWLAAHPTRRLGHYAEALLAFWFRIAPHVELVAANRVVRAGGMTRGEFDFLLRIDGVPWHVETCSKFYLQTGEGLDGLVGPGLNDAWRLKAGKLSRQLALSRDPAAAAVLPADFVHCRVGALIRGRLFFTGGPLRVPPLSDDAPSGWIAPLDGNWPCRSAESRWLHLPRLRWLAPALADDDGVTDAATLAGRLGAAQAPQMVAEMIRAPDGGWLEADRGFVVPADWPDPVRLAALQATVKRCGGPAAPRVPPA